MSQKKAHSSDILGSSDEEVSSAARTSRLADIPEIFVIGGRRTCMPKQRLLRHQRALSPSPNSCLTTLCNAGGVHGDVEVLRKQ